MSQLRRILALRGAVERLERAEGSVRALRDEVRAMTRYMQRLNRSVALGSTSAAVMVQEPIGRPDVADPASPGDASDMNARALIETLSVLSVRLADTEDRWTRLMQRECTLAALPADPRCTVLAANSATQQVSTEYVAFAVPGVWYHPEWLAAACDELDRDPAPVAVYGDYLGEAGTARHLVASSMIDIDQLLCADLVPCAAMVARSVVLPVASPSAFGPLWQRHTVLTVASRGEMRHVASPACRGPLAEVTTQSELLAFVDQWPAATA